MSDRNTILIVDDVPLMRELMSDLLACPDYDVLVAASGIEALALAASHKPDLILLDVMMPLMDGYEVCRLLRDDEQLAQIPVIMVTALDDREARLHGFEAGADEFISKPFDRIELQMRVRSILRLNRYRLLLDERQRAAEQAGRAALDLARAYDVTLEGWARALDLRDKETEGHSRRVTELAVCMARAFGLSETEVIHIRRGALLHDIGKLAVPDAILLKPGPLTDDERAVMRRHPLHSYEMLAPIEFLRPALAIPRYHHERWDGTGYPYGLKGEAIPLAARLFTVVDVWDALNNDRPYRAAWPSAQVYNYIHLHAGSHFDPRVVEVFLDLVAKRQADATSAGLSAEPAHQHDLLTFAESKMLDVIPPYWIGNLVFPDEKLSPPRWTDNLAHADDDPSEPI